MLTFSFFVSASFSYWKYCTGHLYTVISLRFNLIDKDVGAVICVDLWFDRLKVIRARTINIFNTSLIRCFHRNFALLYWFLLGSVLHMRAAERFCNQVLIVLNHDLCFAWWLCPHTFESSMNLLFRYYIHYVLFDKGFLLRPILDRAFADGLLNMDFLPGDNIISYFWRFCRGWFCDQNFCLGRLTFRCTRILFWSSSGKIGNVLYVDFFLCISFIQYILVSGVCKVV